MSSCKILTTWILLASNIEIDGNSLKQPSASLAQQDKGQNIADLRFRAINQNLFYSALGFLLFSLFHSLFINIFGWHSNASFQLSHSSIVSECTSQALNNTAFWFFTKIDQFLPSGNAYTKVQHALQHLYTSDSGRSSFVSGYWLDTHALMWSLDKSKRILHLESITFWA